MKKITFLFVLFFSIVSINAQSIEELNQSLGAKKDSIASLQTKAKQIQKTLDALPGWKLGAFGTVGASLSGFKN